MNMPPRDDERMLWAAVQAGGKPRYAGFDLGIPPDRIVYLCEKWSRQGKYEYGTSIDLGWTVSSVATEGER